MVLKDTELESFIEFLNDPEEIGWHLADEYMEDDETFVDVKILSINFDKQTVMLELIFENEISGKERYKKVSINIDEHF